MSKETAKIKYDILKIGDEARNKKLKDSSIINGTIGSFYNDEGEFKAFNTVKKVINSLSDGEYFSYATSDGGLDYEEAVLKWVFKDSLETVLKNTNCKVVATPGGTGAVFMSMFESLHPGEEILIPDLCWEPYVTIASMNNFVSKRYSLFNEDLEFNIHDFITKCAEMAENQEKVVTILNDPCNNPTGYSLSFEEFDTILDYLNNIDKPVYLIYDIAYFDYAKDIDDVLKKFEIISKMNPHFTILICFSASKSFCTYGMRIGAQIIVNSDEELVNKLHKRSAVIARTHWSNINKAGINTLIKLTSDKELQKEFLDELKVNVQMVNRRIDVFQEEAKKVHLRHYRVDGGFFISIPCNNPPAVFEMLKENGIYLIPLETTIRIAICSIPLKEVYGLAYKIKNIVDFLE